MQVHPFHVFVCDQQNPDGLPCCGGRGSAAVIEKLRAEIGRQGLLDQVQVTVCGSLGLCERGPNMVVYPEGTWYSGVQAGDVAEIVESHFRAGKVVERLLNRDAEGLKAEITTNRTRMMIAMKERDASGALPDPIWQTIRGFQDSRAVLTAIQLDFFSAAGAGATAAEVAVTAHTDPRATLMLLNALVALGLLVKDGEAFRNTPLSARYLAAGGADDSRTALMHTVHLWRNWSRLTECVRAGTAFEHEEIPELGQQWTDAFIAAMHKNAQARAAAVIGALGGGPIRRMLDVGGGSGAYSIAFAKLHPELRADILDLATVTAIARRHIVEAGLEERVTTVVGDLRSGLLGSGYDLVFVSAICHMLSPDENRDLLRRCHDSLAPGGRVVIQDFILDDSGTAPKIGALFALNMLVGTQAGSSYSEAEYRAWLAEAGCSTVRRVPLAGPTGLMEGTRRQ